MFSLNETNKFMVYSTSVDLRKGVEPLCGLARICGRKPSDGSVYVYFNRSRTLMKLLHWERGGYVIYYKRMEVGRISRKVFQAHETPVFYELSCSWRVCTLLPPAGNALIFSKLE